MLDPQPISPDFSCAPKTVLIVDDTPANLRLLANLLSAQGYRVRLAPSGALALSATQQILPDLILLDIRMPRMDGYEVCRKLKLNDLTRAIPVIFLSALQEGADKVKAFAVGGADYVSKPFQPEEVIARVQYQLQLVELQQQLQRQQQHLIQQNQRLEAEICDRKTTAAHLSRMTSQLSTLIRNLQTGVLVADESQSIILTNQTFCTLFGLQVAPADLVGENYSQPLLKSQAQFVQAEQTLQQIEQGLKTGQPINGQLMSLSDGRIFEWDYAPIISQEHLQGHLWQYRDVTARKANEQALLKTSQALAAFSNSLKQLHRLNLKPFETFQDLAEDYLQTGCQILNFSGGLVGSIQEDRYTVAVVQSTIEGFSHNFCCPVEDTFCYEAIRNQKTITYSHIGSLPEMQAHPLYQRFTLESCITTPIFVDGRVYGSLSFFSRAPRSQGFTNHEVEIVELMAQSIGKFIRSQQIEHQRRQAETALRESETRFRQLAERIENVFWILEPSQQCFTYISPAYEKIWGRPCDELLSNPHTWPQAIDPEHREHLVNLQSSGTGYDEEYRILRPDGTPCWIRDRAFPIQDDRGQVQRLVGIAEDITEGKHQEQAFKLIFEGTADKTGSEFFRSLAYYLAEVLQVKYVMVTQRLGPSQIKSLAFWAGDRFVEDCEYNLTGTPCEGVLAGQTVFYEQDVQIDYPQHPTFSKWAISSYFGIPLTDANRLITGHIAVLDVKPMRHSKFRELILEIFAARAGAELERQTFENEIQQARDIADTANRAKSEFLANVSHELRTPLNAILGFTQLILAEGRVDAKTHEYLDIVNRSGSHLLNLINDVLEMSKIEAGKVALQTKPFDLQALLRSLEDMFSLPAQAKGLHLSVEHTLEAPYQIETDESKLRQILINLMGNAVKFTQAGRIILRVQALPAAAPSAALLAQTGPTTSRPQTKTRLRFEVEDTGPGILPEDLETLFEPFVQTKVGQRSQEGTGLGLPISQRFVQLMGGDLRVQTLPDQGSKFSFEVDVNLPKAHARNQTAVSANRRLIEHIAAAYPYRLLVVEDQPANRLLLVRTLEAIGFSVQAAENGAMAVEQAETWQPHMIWMDIRMPVMDGYEATRRIKAIASAPPPLIIALTASAFEEERARVMAAGCDDFVRKPFQMEQIFQKIAQYLTIPEGPQFSSEEFHRLNGELAFPAEVVSAQRTILHQAMSVDWTDALEQAAIKGSDNQVLELIKSIPPQQTLLARVLTHWAQNFQFDSILEMLRSE